MRTRTLVISALLLATATAAQPARAEKLIVSVSNHRVTVTPNYFGEELVLFGSVEKDASTPANRTYDLVVTVSGPRADMVTRRKERRFGIWINTDSRQFLQVPAYLAIFSNRPIDAIASPEVQRRQQLGMNNVVLTQRDQLPTLAHLLDVKVILNYRNGRDWFDIHPALWDSIDSTPEQQPTAV